MFRFIRKSCYTIVALAITCQIILDSGVIGKVSDFIETVQQIEISPETQAIIDKGIETVSGIINDNIAKINTTE